MDQHFGCKKDEKVTTFEAEVDSGHVFGGWGLNDCGVFFVDSLVIIKDQP